MRRVREELETVSRSLPGLLDHRRTANSGRSIRVMYLLGLADAGASREELSDFLDSLEARSDLLRARMRTRERIHAEPPYRRRNVNAS